MMSKKITTFLAVILSISISIFLYFFLGMSITPTSYGKEFLIGMSQSNQVEPYRAKMNKDIQYAAGNHNNIKVIFTDARQSNEKQIGDIQYLLDMGIDLLIVSPIEIGPLDEIISKAHKTIPIIVLDRKLSTENYTLFIGADNYEIGQKAGEYILSHFNNKEATIIEIQGLPGSTPTHERSNGFHSAISANPKITIIKKIQGAWLRDTAEDNTLSYLQSDEYKSPIDAVFAHNDQMALGAYNAFFKLDIGVEHIIGIDGLAGPSGGQDLVQLNILDVTFEYPTGGEEAIEYALKLLNGETFSSKNIVLKSKIIN